MMSAFEQLKIAVAAQYRCRYPEIEADIRLWRGREIAQFRQDLAEKVGGQISEKSFYTYFKQADNEKLPRVDVLDLLSQYAGFAHWAAFRGHCCPAENSDKQNETAENDFAENNLIKENFANHNLPKDDFAKDDFALASDAKNEKTSEINNKINSNEKIDGVKENNNLAEDNSILAANKEQINSLNNTTNTQNNTTNNKIKIDGVKGEAKKVKNTSFFARGKKLIAAAIFILFLAAGQWLWAAFYQKSLISCEFCLINADTRAPIKGQNIAIHQTEEGQSPRLFFADSVSACFSLEAEKGAMLNFVVDAPYYHHQNISRKAENQTQAELIALRTDDYALMLHYFSTAKVEDWQARRVQLQNMLAENLQVVQLARENGSGIAIYNKAEFIDKLTLPINSLKNIQILETRYDDEQRAIYIRFQ
jgi:hypothetical protein